MKWSVKITSKTLKRRDRIPLFLFFSPSLSTKPSLRTASAIDCFSLSHMKTESMARSLQDPSSKRHFHWTNKVGNQDEDDHLPVLPSFKSSSSKITDHHKPHHHHHHKPHHHHHHHHHHQHHKSHHHHHHHHQLHHHHLHHLHLHHHVVVAAAHHVPKRKLHEAALRSVLTAFGKIRSSLTGGMGPRVVGTLFGSKHGHVHVAIQRDPTSQPAFLIELDTPISGLVKEMASGHVRIALECDKDKDKEDQKKKDNKLLEEPVWRTFCNGKQYGYANRRECGAKEWKVLKAVEPISMGAGVLPAAAGDEAESGSDGDGELMYMRAKFERIVGSRDSEAFYMMNPDSNEAPELSIYLLRI